MLNNSPASATHNDPKFWISHASSIFSGNYKDDKACMLSICLGQQARPTFSSVEIIIVHNWDNFGYTWDDDSVSISSLGSMSLRNLEDRTNYNRSRLQSRQHTKTNEKPSRASVCQIILAASVYHYGQKMNVVLRPARRLVLERLDIGAVWRVVHRGTYSLSQEAPATFQFMAISSVSNRFRFCDGYKYQGIYACQLYILPVQHKPLPNLPSHLLLKIALLVANTGIKSWRSRMAKISTLSKDWRGPLFAYLVHKTELKPITLTPFPRWERVLSSVSRHLVDLRLLTGYESMHLPDTQDEIASGVHTLLSFATSLKHLSLSNFDVGTERERRILPSLQGLQAVETLELTCHELDVNQWSLNEIHSSLSEWPRCRKIIITGYRGKPSQSARSQPGCKGAPNAEPPTSLTLPAKSVEGTSTWGPLRWISHLSIRLERQLPSIDTTLLACYPRKRLSKPIKDVSPGASSPSVGNTNANADVKEFNEDKSTENTITRESWCPGLKELHLFGVELIHSQLLLFIPIPSPGLTNVAFDNVRGATNNDLFAFLSRNANALETLSIRRSIFPPSENEKFALDEAMPLLIRLREAELFGCDMTCAAFAWQGRRSGEEGIGQMGDMKVIMRGKASEKGWGGFADTLLKSRWKRISIQWTEESELWASTKSKAQSIAEVRNIELSI